MSLLGVVPFPPAKLRNKIDPSEWNAFLSAWSSLARAYAGLPQDEFLKLISRPETKIETFLETFMQHAASVKGRFSQTEAERSLKQSCLSLLERISDGTTGKFTKLRSISFIEDFCLVYLGSVQAGSVGERLWQASRKTSGTQVLSWKEELIRFLSSDVPRRHAGLFRLARLVACLKTIPSCGSFLMEGSDFLDTLVSTWEALEGDISRKLTLIALYCFTSLLDTETKNSSLILDHLYSLKTNHEERIRHKKASSLLEQLLGSTPLLLRLQDDSTINQGRGQSLLRELQKIASTSGLQRRKISPRIINKGKGKAKDQQDGELHIHRMSLVTQVRDLFPSLAVPKILHLLDAYDDNPERVIAHLLDNLPDPADFEDDTDDTTAKPLPTVEEVSANLPPHAPYINQLPSRKNVYDDEDLATLSVDAARLHIGRREESTVLQTPSTSNKAAILSALAAFDSDSDERDDTYDVDDVGGTVDNTVGGADDDNADNEETLYLAWKSTPELFGRDTATRRGKPRIDLRTKTGLTDEAIEGWGIMLSRDTRRQGRLEKRFAAFAGQQTELGPSSWQASEETVNSDGEIQRHQTDRGRGGRIRGRGPGRGGRGGRGGGGSASGADGAVGGPATANDRRRKDANKSSRANHNRRDQRAKKVSRAGFPG